MINNVALDVVIGLVFVYLLYSLFATVIGEIIATTISLRARNLREAVDRMLNDENEEAKRWTARLWDSLKLTKKADSLMVNNFYNHPEIKYLGSTGVFKYPSAFKAFSFAKTIIYQLSGEGPADRFRIKEKLERLKHRGTALEQPLLTADEIIFDKETAKYVLSLWDESYGDIAKFKLHLETWFDRTMEQALEWYKRKIQVVLTVLGFLMAWFFYADSFVIIRKLSTDKDAREKMVMMASAYVQNNPTSGSAMAADTNYARKLDSLLAIKRQLEADVANANSVLGLGGWLPDKLRYSTDPSSGRQVFIPQADENIIKRIGYKLDNESGELNISGKQKLYYFLWLFPFHFAGFLVTAIAISLGAPFWFDLLNKLMKLRTSVKHGLNTASHHQVEGVSPLNREG